MSCAALVSESRASRCLVRHALSVGGVHSAAKGEMHGDV